MAPLKKGVKIKISSALKPIFDGSDVGKFILKNQIDGNTINDQGVSF